MQFRIQMILRRSIFKVILALESFFAALSGVPTLVILGELDGPNPLDQLAAEIPGAKKVVMAETAHHPFMEKPAEFNQIVLDLSLAT